MGQQEGYDVSLLHFFFLLNPGEILMEFERKGVTVSQGQKDMKFQRRRDKGEKKKKKRKKVGECCNGQFDFPPLHPNMNTLFQMISDCSSPTPQLENHLVPPLLNSEKKTNGISWHLSEFFLFRLTFLNPSFNFLAFVCSQ